MTLIKRLKRKYILLIITILWMGFIFYMSSKPAVESAADSSQIVDLLSRWLGISSEFSEGMSFIVRKTAHFTEYFILAALITTTNRTFNNGKLNFSFILLMVVLTALGDEFLQGFIDGRSSEVRDVLIDFSGGVAFLIIFKTFMYIKVKSSCIYQKKDE